MKLAKDTVSSSAHKHEVNSMITTQMMAQMVNAAVQPSDKSSFQFTMKYFKPVVRNDI